MSDYEWELRQQSLSIRGLITTADDMPRIAMAPWRLLCLFTTHRNTLSLPELRSECSNGRLACNECDIA